MLFHLYSLTYIDTYNGSAGALYCLIVPHAVIMGYPVLPAVQQSALSHLTVPENFSVTPGASYDYHIPSL